MNDLKLLLFCSLAIAACGDQANSSDPGGPDCAGGKCDEADGPVSIRCLEDHSGQNRSSIDLGDALAKLVFADGECEQGFEDTVAALKDTGKCRDHRTMAVSEIAQRIGAKPPFFRTVTALDCEVGQDEDGNKLIGGVWFSLFASPDATPGSFDSAEAIAFDPVAGVFNYYDTSAAEIQFFGNSMQFIQDTRSPSQAAGSSIARCAGCHRGGGLIMKELPAPWMHWEPDFRSPGHDQMIQTNAESMGSPTTGVELETGIVRPSNRSWNRSRISKVVAGLGTTTDVELLLRPLFCTEDINIAENFNASVSSGQLGGGVILDQRLSGFTSIPIKKTEYDAIKKEFGQKMASQLRDFDDTVGAMSRVFRGASDVDYQDQLRSVAIDRPDGTTDKIQIVDTEFIEDVLLVDFTRALQFAGDDRCNLLRFAPDLTADELTPDNIRDGFIANLEGETSKPAKDFLSYLKSDEDDAKATVRAFENACNDRKDKKEANGKSVSGAAFDYLSVLFHNRRRATRMPVFEFDGLTVPENDSFPAGTRLDPNTCMLTTDYVSPVVVGLSDPDPGRGGGSGGEGIDSCEDRCGNFDEDAACQCDETCLGDGDCCDDFTNLCPDVTATLSCRNRCGADDEELFCKCDFGCDERGDCCSDWGAECMDPTNIDPGPAPDPRLSCKQDGGDRCSTFEPGANCQCNDGCLDFGNCCPDFSLVCGGAGEEPGADQGCLHLAEVMYDADGSDDGAEWVKIYNSCSSSQSLDGMSLGYGGKEYTSGGLDLSGALAAGKCVIIGGPVSSADNGEPRIDREANFRPDLQNSGSLADGIALFSVPAEDVTNATVPVDAVIYGGSNGSNLVDRRGNTVDPHVADAPEGSSILRTDRNTWKVSEPSPTTCPDF